MTSLLISLIFAAGEPRWELAAEDTGLKVYARKRADSDVHEMKAVGVIDAPPHDVWKAVRDYENYPKTMPFTEEGKVLSHDVNDKVVVFYSKINTPLVDRRDYIIKLIDESDWKDGKGFLKVSWTAVNDQDAAVPLKEDVVRVRINDGFWLLEPREGGKKCFTTYYIYTDPGGSIPNFVANKGNTMAVPKVFAAIRKLVAKDGK